MTKVLLTGGAGYIGSHAAVALQAEGYEVIILDNFSNSSPSVLDAIAKISGVKPKMLLVDLYDRHSTLSTLASVEFDAVMHFAGLKAVGDSIKNPGEYYRKNTVSTVNLLDAVKMHSVKNLIFSSSATVYGDPETLPLSEDSRTGVGITNPYGWTKFFCEQIIKDYYVDERKPISSIALRYFNPIGAHSSGLIGEKPNGVPNNLFPYITQTAAGIREHLSIFGNDYDTEDGTCERDYIHVEDLAEAHVSALRLMLESSDPLEPMALNIGTGKPTSVLKLVESFEEANGVKVARKFSEKRAGDLAQLYADPSKANEILGWSASRSLEDSCRSGWLFETKIRS